MYNKSLQELIIKCSNIMQDKARTAFYDYRNVEREDCREIEVEIRLIDGSFFLLQNKAIDSLKEKRYEGSIINVFNGIVEIIGMKGEVETHTYIPIDRVLSISLRKLAPVKWNEETKTLSCGNIVYCFAETHHKR